MLVAWPTHNNTPWGIQAEVGVGCLSLCEKRQCEVLEENDRGM
jgi:hypothetical protein